MRRGGGIYRRREKRKEGKESGGGRCGVVGCERFMRGKRLEKDEILIRMGSTSRQQRERERRKGSFYKGEREGSRSKAIASDSESLDLCMMLTFVFTLKCLSFCLYNLGNVRNFPFFLDNL